MKDATDGAVDDGQELLSEVHKFVTVLALEVAPLTERRRLTNPERLRHRLDEAAASPCDVLAAWGGMVERHVAGSVIAVFGLPATHEDDASRALQAALEVVESSVLPVRIGVNTGEIIGPTGLNTKPDAVAGETMVVAHRLREAARPTPSLPASGRIGPFGPGSLSPSRSMLLSRLADRRYVPAGCSLGLPAPRSPTLPSSRRSSVATSSSTQLPAFSMTSFSTGQPRLVTRIGPAGWEKVA